MKKLLLIFFAIAFTAVQGGPIINSFRFGGAPVDQTFSVPSQWSTNTTGLVARFDLRDRTSLFQDTAGTATVAAGEDPVAYVADKSGNGNNLTQGVTGARPFYVPKLNGGGLKFNHNEFLTNKGFILAQPYTMFATYYLPSSNVKSGTNAPSFSEVLVGNIPGVSSNGVFYVNSTDGGVDDGGNCRAWAGTISADFNVKNSAATTVTIIYDGTNSFVRTNGQPMVGPIDLGTQTRAGLSAGAYTDGTAPSVMHLSELMFYNHHLSAQELSDVEGYAYTTNLFYAKNILDEDGDSHRRGAQSGPWGDAPYQCISNLLGNWTLNNRGISGQTSWQGITNWTDLTRLYSPLATRQVAFEEFGANDFSQNVSLASLEQYLTNKCRGDQNAGFQVIVCTLQPHDVINTYTSNNWWTFNNFIITNYTNFADGLANYTANPQFAWTSNDVTTVFSSDHIHENDSGYFLKAGYDAAAVNLLPSTSGNRILKNMVAFYPMNEVSGDALDISGNGRTLYQNGTVGASGGKRTFSSTDNTDFFSRTNDAGFSPGTGADWTMISVVSLTAASGANGIMGRYDTTSGSLGYEMLYNSSAFATFSSANGTSATTTTATGAATAGQEYMVVSTYLNLTGALSCQVWSLAGAGITFSGSGSMVGGYFDNSTTPFSVGVYWTGGAPQNGGDYGGTIRYSGVWRSILSPTKISEIFAGNALKDFNTFTAQ